MWLKNVFMCILLLEGMQMLSLLGHLTFLQFSALYKNFEVCVWLKNVFICTFFIRRVCKCFLC